MAAAVAIVVVGLAARAIGRGGGEKEEGGMGEMGGMGGMGWVGVVGEKEGREGEAAGCSVIRGSKESKRTSHVFAEKEPCYYHYHGTCVRYMSLSLLRRDCPIVFICTSLSLCRVRVSLCPPLLVPTMVPPPSSTSSPLLPPL